MLHSLNTAYKMNKNILRVGNISFLLHGLKLQECMKVGAKVSIVKKINNISELCGCVYCQALFHIKTDL